VIDWLSKFPTTNGRIVFTLVLVLVTAIRYLVFGVPMKIGANNIPIVDGWGYWLLFLAGMAGLDVAQFAAKRATFDSDAHATGAVREASEPSPPVPAVIDNTSTTSATPAAPDMHPMATKKPSEANDL
jgi:hypothetical protein